MRLYELVLALPSKRAHDEAIARQLRWHVMDVVVVWLDLGRWARLEEGGSMPLDS